MGDAGKFRQKLKYASALVHGHRTLFKIMEVILVNMDHKHKGKDRNSLLLFLENDKPDYNN